jgi:hypothetical protein
MQRQLFAGILLLGLWSAVAPVQAQGPAYNPPVSPYINLSRQFGNVNNPGIAYYGIVRPQQEFRSSIQRLEFSTTTFGQAVSPQDQSAALPPTGHRVGFLNQSVYFQTLRPGAFARPTQSSTTPTIRPADTSSRHR